MAGTMNIVDRFTRDRVSRFLWGAVTVAFVVLLVVSLVGGRAALNREEQAAEARAVRYTDTVLFESLDAEHLADPIIGAPYRALVIALQGGVMTDPFVARVRIWAPDGTLLFSTDGSKRVIVKATDTTPIEAAVGGSVTSSIATGTVAAKANLSGKRARLYETFVPLRVPDRTSILGAVELDQFHSEIVAAAQEPWRTLQIALAIGAALGGLLFALSMRRATNRIGAGVARYAPEVDGPTVEGRALRMRNELERVRGEHRKLEQELVHAREALELAIPSGPTSDDAPKDGPDGSGPLQAATAELERVRTELEQARSAEREARDEVAAAEERAAAVREVLEETARARSAASPPEPAILERLERRIVAAEERAVRAEEKVAHLTSGGPSAPVGGFEEPAGAAGAEEAADDEVERSPEATALRNRLARTAARKKLLTHGDDQPGEN